MARPRGKGRAKSIFQNGRLNKKFLHGYPPLLSNYKFFKILS